MTLAERGSVVENNYDTIQDGASNTAFDAACSRNVDKSDVYENLDDTDVIKKKNSEKCS